MATATLILAILTVILGGAAFGYGMVALNRHLARRDALIRRRAALRYEVQNFLIDQI